VATVSLASTSDAVQPLSAIGEFARARAHPLTELIFLSSFFTNPLNPCIIGTRIETNQGKTGLKSLSPYSKQTSRAFTCITEPASYY